MNNTLGLGSLKSFAQLTQQPAGSRGIESMIAHQQGVQRDTPDVFHDDARSLRIVERGVVKCNNVRMLEPRHQQRFALKALAELGIRRNVVVHDFDHDLTAKIDLPSEVNSTHAPLTKEPDRLIPSQKHAADHARSR